MENIPQVANGASVSLIILQQSPGLGMLAPAVQQSSLSQPAMVQPSPQHQQILPKPQHSQCAKTKASSVGLATSTRTPPLKPAKKLRTEDNEILRCKRRLDFAKLGLHFQRPCPVAVSRRNERERKRVKQINHTFVHLRDHLPSLYWGDKNPSKVSKVDTLRAAIDYINNLQDLIDNHDAVTAAFHTAAFVSTPVDTAPTQPLTVSAPAITHIPPQASSVPQPPITSPGASSCASACSSEIPSNDPPLSPEEEELLDFASWFQ